MNETQDQNVPPLRPEAYVVRGDRTLAAMVLLICTLGGVGIGFGTALYMLRVSSLSAVDVRPQKVVTLTYLGTTFDTRFRGPGVRISQVWESSPAERANLQKNDVILRIDETWLTSRADFVREIRQRDPGDRATLLVDRGGKQVTLSAILGSF